MSGDANSSGKEVATDPHLPVPVFGYSESGNAATVVEGVREWHVRADEPKENWRRSETNIRW